MRYSYNARQQRYPQASPWRDRQLNRGRYRGLNQTGLYRPHCRRVYEHTQQAGSQIAKVAELVDALVLGASGATRESSSLSFRTKILTR